MRAKASGLLKPVNGKPPVRTFLAMSGGGDDGAFGAGLLTVGPRAATGRSSPSSPG